MNIFINYLEAAQQINDIKFWETQALQHVEKSPELLSSNQKAVTFMLFLISKNVDKNKIKSMAMQHYNIQKDMIEKLLKRSEELLHSMDNIT